MGRLVLDRALQKLEKSTGTDGLHPDGIHCSTQICLKATYCTVMVIDSTQTPTVRNAVLLAFTGAPIARNIFQASKNSTGAPFTVPLYCRKWGKPYPWVEERLRTARELLRNAKELTEEDRIELGDLLQYCNV
jgi:hypothetical protein